jgi:hypothetical protein
VDLNLHFPICLDSVHREDAKLPPTARYLTVENVSELVLVLDLEIFAL